MSLRVLTISKPYVAAAYREKLTRLARDHGMTVGLICPPAWGTQAFEPGDDRELWLKLLPIVANGHNHLHLYRGLADAMRAFAPDIVNVEEEHYSLVTFQAYRSAAQLGAASLFYTWQNILKRYPPPFAWTERYVLKNSAAGVAGNAEAAAVLRAKGYGGELREIPQMGVSVEHWAPEMSSEAARASERHRLGLKDSGLWVGFAGRLVEEKGLSTLLTAAAQLKGLGTAVNILLIGDGPHRATLAQMASDLHINERVHFLPTVASQAVAPYLRAVDIVCLPSLTRPNWKEQFGRLLIEAMAAEAVVMGSSSGEIPRVIGDAGLVFPEGDAGALAAHLSRLSASHNAGVVRDDSELTAWRQRGAARVRARYTHAAVATALADVLRHVAAQRLANSQHRTL